VPEVVEKLVTETFAFVGAGNEARDVEEFDRDGATAGDAGAVVGSAAVGEVVARAGAIDLEVANCTLRVDSGEASMETCSGSCANWRKSCGEIRLTENCLRTDQRRFFMAQVVVVEN
jgi:hypothetical protein